MVHKNNSLYLKNYEDLELILNKPLKNEKHQTRVSLLLELVSDVYLTANRTGTCSLPRRLLYH